MLITKRFIEFIVFSNIWIALLAAGLVLNTYLINSLPINFEVCLLVFLATFSIYNLQRVVKHFLRKNNFSKRHNWIYNNVKTLALFVVLSSTGSFLLFFSIFSFNDFLYLLPFTLISGLYAVSTPNKRALRDFPFIKIFLIAITWAITTVLIPFLQAGTLISITFYGQFLFVFLFIIAITIPFDIRDLELDDKSTKTLPQILGVQNAIYLAYVLLLVGLVINYLSFFNIVYPIIIAITLILISFSNKKMPELFYSGILDGVMILFPLFNYFWI
ncbi:MAG: hypothetical protein N4A35_09795 [Flavobacteriales bacterium]|nr:hypothetical protein [Flavobacteriales bacterium]